MSAPARSFPSQFTSCPPQGVLIPRVPEVIVGLLENCIPAMRGDVDLLAWYVPSVADYRSAFVNLATMVVLLFRIYYRSVVFVLSGEVVQVYTMRTARKVQIRAAFGSSA